MAPPSASASTPLPLTARPIRRSLRFLLAPSGCPHPRGLSCEAPPPPPNPSRLPTEEVERQYPSWPEVADAIRSLVVRGAPAIGVTAAFGVALAAVQSRAATFDGPLADQE